MKAPFKMYILLHQEKYILSPNWLIVSDRITLTWQDKENSHQSCKSCLGGMNISHCNVSALIEIQTCTTLVSDGAHKCKEIMPKLYFWRRSCKNKTRILRTTALTLKTWAHFFHRWAHPAVSLFTGQDFFLKKTHLFLTGKFQPFTQRFPFIALVTLQWRV